MKSQLITDHVHVQMDSHGPDLSDLLRDIRAQYDLAAKKNREESEEWYNAKVLRKNCKIQDKKIQLFSYCFRDLFHHVLLYFYYLHPTDYYS